MLHHDCPVFRPLPPLLLQVATYGLQLYLARRQAKQAVGSGRRGGRGAGNRGGSYPQAASHTSSCTFPSPSIRASTAAP